jgi:hypothetical protein
MRYIAKHDLRCMQFADSACKGIQRVTDNFLQQPIRISASLLQPAGSYWIAACKTFYFRRFCSILHALLFNTFWLFAKRRQTTFRTDTKGNTVTFPNNVTQVILFIVILNSSLLVSLFVKSAKELCFIDLKSYLFKSGPWLQIACGIRELHAMPILFSNTAGRLNLNKKSVFGV